jgi:hypothetical protein
MSDTPVSFDGSDPEPRPEHAAGVPRPLVTAAVGERCPNCQSPLATDQVYCLNCGERRGKARFAFSSHATAPVAAQPAARPPRAPRRPRVSSSATLVTGIGTLLLAMGVGVLIGEQGRSDARTTAAVTPQIITVGGGGAAPAAATTPAARETTSTGHSRKPKKVVKVVVTKKVAAKAAAAAQGVLGGNSHLASPTTSVGGSCSNGQAGCQNGTFTGNFFGP